MKRELYLFLTIAVLLLLSACTASQPEESPLSASATAAPAVEPMAGDDMESSGEAMMESEDQPDKQETESEMAEPEMVEPSMVAEMPESAEEMTEEMAAESSDDEMMEVDRPAWQQLALTNARTGETFTLADFAGKTVFVEPMATWCSNCRRQLDNVREAKTQLASDDVVFVALSVETNIDDATLASYADEAGFDWLFAVLTPDMLRQLAGEFGQTIANPPATPHFVIQADGSTTELVTGIEPAGQIISQITAVQG